MFLTTAMGSANEMEVHLKIAAELGYGADGECQRLAEEYNVVGRQLNRLIVSWRDGAPTTSNEQRATRN